MTYTFPSLPGSVRASSLLHGSDADFVINAYLALQRQWPDQGGFAHYRYVLSQPGAQRSDVLRQIAASDNARRCGVEFIDDLPPDHQFRPEHHDPYRLSEINLSLRLGRTIKDVAEIRRAVSSLTGNGLREAMEALLIAQQGHQALVDSEINSLKSEIKSRDTAVSPQTDLGDQEHPPNHLWQHLARQQMTIDADVQCLKQSLTEMRGQLEAMQRAFEHLHQFATVELKRQVADYVNALHSAHRAQEQPASVIGIIAKTGSRARGANSGSRGRSKQVPL